MFLRATQAPIFLSYAAMGVTSFFELTAAWHEGRIAPLTS
jgi:hypothetical protein